MAAVRGTSHQEGLDVPGRHGRQRFGENAGGTEPTKMAIQHRMKNAALTEREGKRAIR